MSQSEIFRFPKSPVPPSENNPDAANQARQRISRLPSPYVSHAAPSKEDLVGAIHPVSPAAESAGNTPAKEAAPFSINSSDPKSQPPPPTNPPAQQTEQPKEEPQPPEASTSELNMEVHEHLLPPSPGSQAQTQIPQTESAPAAKPANPLEQLKADVPAKTSPNTTRRQPVPEPKSLPSRFMPLIVGVVTFALVLLAAKAPIFLNQLGYFTQSKPSAQITPPKANAAVVVPPDPVITIPKINVSAPVIYTDNNAEPVIQKHLESGVVHYAGTAEPGTKGNSVIFGHSSNDWWEPGNYKFVFVLLDKLVPGDTFTVNYKSKQYLYEVTGSKVVQPTDLSVLNPTPEPTMTLITCTPPGTSWQRLVVTAKQISPAPDDIEPTPADAPDGDVSADGELPGNAPGIVQRFTHWLQNLFTRE